jgi:hypothetical protein
LETGAAMKNDSRLTLGLGVALFGTSYSEFFPNYWKGVQSLSRQPDAVVVAHDAQNKDWVDSVIPQEYKTITKIIEMQGEFADYLLAIQTEQTTDWISICGADDYYLPGAFDELDQADAQGCDIYIDKIQMKHDGSIMEGRWIPELIPERMTCPGAAPIKRELFERAGGHTKGAIFDDWELYIRCVAADAKPFHASTIRIIYDIGYGRVTMSGVGRPSSHDEIGKAHIQRVRQELGL